MSKTETPHQTPIEDAVKKKRLSDALRDNLKRRKVARRGGDIQGVNPVDDKNAE